MSSRKTVFISGAGRGLGLTFAQKFAEAGYDLVLNYRRDQGKSAANINQFLQSDLGKRVNVVLAKADISESKDIQQMVKMLKEKESIHIDHIVLNAASAPFKNIIDMTRSDWKILLNTNLIGNVSCITELLPFMPDGGSISVITSVGSRLVLPKYPLGMMKAALENLVMYLNFELKQRDIRVNGVCAGLVNTDMTPFLKDLWPEFFNRLKNKADKYLIDPEEIADVVLFLASEQSKAIRGTTLLADYGLNYCLTL